MSYEPIRVAIDNLPSSQHWLITWSPIFISLLALMVSIVSIRRAAKEAKDSSRPYLYTANITLPPNPQQILHDPLGIYVVVTNSPAKLIYAKYLLEDNSGNELYKNERNEPVFHFPHEGSSSQHRFGGIDLNNINSDLFLKMHLKYTDLSGGQEYEYKANNKYEYESKVWKHIDQKAT